MAFIRSAGDAITFLHCRMAGCIVTRYGHVGKSNRAPTALRAFARSWADCSRPDDKTRRLPHILADCFSVLVPDPVGSGLVNRLSRPGGNVTGFTAYEYNLSGKWLELLKQTAPGITQVAVLRDPALTAGIGLFAIIQSVASSLGVEVMPINVGNATHIERAIDAFARESNGGLIVTPRPRTAVHRELIVTMAARHKLPAVYAARYFIAGGGLVSYGPNYVDQFRRAAGYVDRILKGEKPADMPVQATKYELKSAKALGITIPATLLATADEVIE
jgi:putative ABC transport system substrate-binding protein